MPRSPAKCTPGVIGVVPHLNGLAYIEKPPLQYWATALSYCVFGPSEFAARLYMALTAFGTIVVVWLVARRLWSPAAGWRAAALLPGMLMVSRARAIADAGHESDVLPDLEPCRLFAGTAGPAAADLDAPGLGGGALGVLTKGLVAAAIPVAVLLLYSLYTRDFAPWQASLPGLGPDFVPGNDGPLALACRREDTGFFAVLFRTRTPGPVFDARVRPRGALVVLRLGLFGRQCALDCIGAARAVRRVASGFVARGRVSTGGVFCGYG